MLRSVVIVTGASKGFGSAVAKAFAKSCPGSIHFVLSARNQQELNETKCEILQIRHILNLETTCETVLGDITDSKQLERLAEGLFNSVTHKDDNSLPVSITFVNNAGSLGPLRPIGSPLTSFSEIATAVNLNVTGCLYLTSEFVRR